MRLIVQRVANAKVEVDGKVVGKIGKGFMVLCRNNTFRHRKRSRLSC